MAYRKRSRASTSLFPFLSVLLCAMGVLIVVISGQNLMQVGSGNLDQVIEIGTGSYQGKAATYVECGAEGVILYPDKQQVPKDRVLDEAVETAWSKLLDELEAHNDERYLVLLIRPQGIDTYFSCRSQAEERQIEVGKDALLAGGEITFTRNGKPVLASGGQ